jgi:hypothetical protein
MIEGLGMLLLGFYSAGSNESYLRNMPEYDPL